MNKKIANIIITILSVIILAGIIIAIILMNASVNVEPNVAKCIGENSTLYVKLGCPHCAAQEKLFGKEIEYITIVDCFYEPEKCSEISAVPTWKIKDEYYLGIQSIEKLQELTGC
ncbi:MAG: hypothetical protein WC812_01815 [Candidatus Pacearchaeota archaeon]|jgi:glutaredoxin